MKTDDGHVRKTAPRTNNERFDKVEISAQQDEAKETSGTRMASISGNVWHYTREHAGGLTEYARFDGGTPPSLGMHFHDECQFAVVLEGSRVFQLQSQIVRVSAGECLYIPVRLPHRSLPSAAARCFNLYVPEGGGPWWPIVLPIPDILGGDHVDPAGLVALARAYPTTSHADSAGYSGFSEAVEWDDRASIGEIASRLGMRRESFTRLFSRRVGMSPNAFRIVARLNAARRMIKAGAPVADTAADCGFADQSHLGRHFRRVFGVTPRTYLEAMR